MKAYTISTDGERRELFPRPRMEEDGLVLCPDTFTRSELEDIVAGYVEVIPMTDEVVMIVNDNGEGRDLPLNRAATELLIKANPKTEDYILGNVVVCKASMIKGEEL